jgi:hypothetical protein
MNRNLVGIIYVHIGRYEDYNNIPCGKGQGCTWVLYILKGVTISVSIYKVWLQLKQWFQGEAHWAGPVSLTFHSVLRKLP